MWFKNYLFAITSIVLLFVSMPLQAQDEMPSAPRHDNPSSTDVEPIRFPDPPKYEEPAEETFEDIDYYTGDKALTIQNLYDTLIKYGVKHPKIVLAQALLETGYFSSNVCHRNRNLFGLRHPSDGSYYTFAFWEQSVKAYRDDVQYKYKGGDYYSFLYRIGYAEDINYVDKVRRIASTL